MTRRRKGKRLPPLLLPPLQVQSQLLVAPCRRLLHPRPGIDGRTQNSCPRRLGDHLHNLEPSRSSTCEKQGGTQACRRMTTSLTEYLTRRHSRLWTSRNSRSRSPRPLHSATQTYGPPPILKCQTRSGLRPSLSSLLRRSLLLHRKPMLVWKRRKWCWEGANSLERREDGRAGRELRGSKLRRSGPAQKAMRPRAASRGHQ